MVNTLCISVDFCVKDSGKSTVDGVLTFGNVIQKSS